MQLEPFAQDILSHLQHRALPGSSDQAYILAREGIQQGAGVAGEGVPSPAAANQSAVNMG
ncbi:hypothetical protein MesoLj131b_12800 [Mesorhizobium sp. 131-2-5]|nr:hypothetical protein MesoLj131b_12800 [Mesorhizobium sp. 131-2-5]